MTATTIFCSKCNEPIEVPDELLGEFTASDIVNFVCDACDPDSVLDVYDYDCYDFDYKDAIHDDAEDEE